MRIALATCSALPDLDEDGALLRAALPEAEVHAWDAGVGWDAFDLVVIRSTWDYHARRDEFVAWARSVPRLANSAEIVDWNTDKTYLRRLSYAGLPIVPTTWLAPGDAFSVPAERFVVKPTISAGARHTAAYAAGDQASVAHVTELLEAGRPVMVQPYVEAIDGEGETSVLVVDGAVSHAARKAAILAGAVGVRNDIDSRSYVTPAEATAEQVELALECVSVVRSWGHELLYARVDMLPGPVLIELELTEPSLFLRHSAGSPERFAAAVRRWASRSSAGASRRR